MDAAVKTETENKFVTVAGLRTRYIEQGQGPAIVLLHGASLGSSADVFRRNLAPLAGMGFRVIAYDQPGFGLSDDPPDWGIKFRTAFILQFMDALGIDKATMIGHSQAGNMAVELALSNPDRVERIAVLGTGSLLKPLPEGDKKAGPAEGEEGGDTEPTEADARAAGKESFQSRSDHGRRTCNPGAHEHGQELQGLPGEKRRRREEQGPQGSEQEGDVAASR